MKKRGPASQSVKERGAGGVTSTFNNRQTDWRGSALIYIRDYEEGRSRESPIGECIICFLTWRGIEKKNKNGKGKNFREKGSGGDDILKREHVTQGESHFKRPVRPLTDTAR